MNSTSNLPPVEDLSFFAPDASRARQLDRLMRARLAESLRYIHEQAEGQLVISDTAFADCVERIDAGPVSPLAFAIYSEAVLAIEEDDLGHASDLFCRLVTLPQPSSGVVVKDLADPRSDFDAARYARAIDTDPAVPFDIFPPKPEASALCRGAIDAAFALMDSGDSALAGEIRALLREIILAAGNEKPGEFTFDGASSFMLWGGIVINANRDDGVLSMVQMLAHESAHNLLFGLSADASLIENSVDERYASPLRADPRPMDGIYHATFVTARMYRVVRTLLESGVLDAAQRVQAEKELVENERLFRKGIVTVQEHARTTPVGKAVMQGAIDYMAEKGVIV